MTVASRKTCDKCTHYTPTDDTSPGNYQFAGKCVLIEDSNEISPRVDEDKVSAWDYEGYRAGAYVGPKFGCIHWVRKLPPEATPLNCVQKALSE